MERTAKLNGKDIQLSSSLFTIISYRQIFGSELFEDVDKLDKALQKNKNEIGKFVDILFRIIYVLHKPYTNDTYDQFLQKLDFAVLSDTKELEDLVKVIGELLGQISPNKGNTNSPR